MSNPTAATDHVAPPRAALVEWAYRLSLAAKGLLGLAQLVGGAALSLSPSGTLPRVVDWLTRGELLEDPGATLALALRTWARDLPVQSDTVYALYLLGHGALNFGVVVALLLRIRGAYHVSLAILLGFIAYQMTEYLKTHDPALLVLSVIDGVVVALVLLERRMTRGEPR